MRIRGYLALTRVSMLDQLQFRAGSFVTLFGNLAYLVLIYFLWSAIYQSAGTEVVNGMTFNDTLIYLVLATAIFSFMEMYVVWGMGRSIQSGAIVLDMIKPMEYRRFMFWGVSGNIVISFFMTFLPTFLIVYFMTGGAIPLGLNLLWFVLSIVFSVIINFSIDFIIGTVCLYTQSIWGINIMKEVIVLLLSGATIPLAFFPEPLKTIAYCLPFQSIYNAPLSLLMNADMPMDKVLVTLATQLFWAVFVLIASELFWRRSMKIITVNGG